MKLLRMPQAAALSRDMGKKMIEGGFDQNAQGNE